MTFNEQIEVFCSKNQLEFLDVEGGYVFVRQGDTIYPIHEEYVARWVNANKTDDVKE